jgi:L-ascorbate oxidase
MAANANSNYQSSSGFNVNRTAQEQHPMHLHGQHFWDLGQGMGMYDRSMENMLNLQDPPFRDTSTLPMGGWSMIQFTVRGMTCALLLV